MQSIVRRRGIGKSRWSEIQPEFDLLTDVTFLGGDLGANAGVPAPVRTVFERHIKAASLGGQRVAISS